MSVERSEMFAHVSAVAAATIHITNLTAVASETSAHVIAVRTAIRYITNLTKESESVAHTIAVRTAICYITNLTAVISESVAHLIAVCTAVYNIIGSTEIVARLPSLTAALNNICLKVMTGLNPVATTVLLDASGEAVAGTSPDAAFTATIATILRRSVLIQHVFVVGTRLGERVC